ncbi:hypothetical protein B0H67DRAFT_642643 [Lasiosphaeris hirsuta]|uniref:Uncharacterized protein n=1 Tax=Lasiosphaeris hirsuta TaxID=260670 RepID=A0AA40AP13_9PEZI|nr:hypothetical protein B0H67DRAFT_642643 [Lasiosphaeris hirsuta]
MSEREASLFCTTYFSTQADAESATAMVNIWDLSAGKFGTYHSLLASLVGRIMTVSFRVSPRRQSILKMHDFKDHAAAVARWIHRHLPRIETIELQADLLDHAVLANRRLPSRHTGRRTSADPRDMDLVPFPRLKRFVSGRGGVPEFVTSTRYWHTLCDFHF